ncbi:MAG: S41 family peptidase [Chloroflexi bacterium]|nr:S41 family peptidase [Chloroflexota bacterium]
MPKTKGALSKMLLVIATIFIVSFSTLGCQALTRAGRPVSTATPQATATPTAQFSLPEGVPQEFSILWETWRILSEDFVDKSRLDPKTLSEGAVKGMIEALKDPYTSYINAQHFRMEQEDLKGKFEGIGAWVDMKEGQVLIVAPMEGSPAEQAGIKAGDVIVEVDGQPTKGMTLIEAILKIRGLKGTTVRLLIRHVGETGSVEIVVTRAEIKVESVKLNMLPGNIAHIKISSFSERTPDELTAALKDARIKGVKGIALDLRNNPGGLLEETVEVASQFLKEGLVLYEVDNKGERRDWPVRRGGLATQLPLVVLVNEYSASGSEVLAGSIQDHKRASLVGIKTFGKGSVNTFRQLSDGSGLYITFARWYTPNGNLIEGLGLKPDIEVVLTQEDMQSGKDPQLDAALDYLKSQIKG